MEELVSDKQCIQILKGIDPICTFESFELEPLQEESMGGLLGHHYTLYIQYKQSVDKKNLQIFVKTLNKTSKIMFRISTRLLMFEKESLLLMKLIPLFEKSGIDVSFAPRSYLCENYTVFMEDLSLSEFRLFPKTEPLDLEHCYSCLTALAKFHVSSISFEILRSNSSGVEYSLFEEYPDILRDLVFSGGTSHLKTAVGGLLMVAKLEFGEDIELNDFENTLHSVISNYNENSISMNCLLHGDLWSNNFLHRYDENKLVETKLIDFQTLNYGPPGLDVLQFIYSNTRKQFRDEYFENLQNYYYHTLEELLHERSLYIHEILPKEEFDDSFEKLKVTAKLMSAIDRCTTCLPDRAYFDVINIEENLEQFIFGDRGKFLVGPYQSIPEYKDIISEDLRELREMLRGSC